MIKKQNFKPEVWATIFALYESGKFTSVKELSIYCHKILKQCPTEAYIKRKLSVNAIDKKALTGAIEEKKRKKFIEIFSDLGADDEACAKEIVKGIHAADDIRKEIQEKLEKIDALIPKISDEKVREDLFLKLLNISPLLAPYFTNLNTSLKYLQERFKLTNSYKTNQPGKQSNTGGGDEIPFPEDKYDDWTVDALDSEIKRLERAMGK